MKFKNEKNIGSLINYSLRIMVIEWFIVGQWLTYNRLNVTMYQSTTVIYMNYGYLLREGVVVVLLLFGYFEYKFRVY